jgi:hypothetical protein
VDVSLGHDLERDGADRLDAVAEVEPFPVFLGGEPAGGELDQFGTI